MQLNKSNKMIKRAQTSIGKYLAIIIIIIIGFILLLIIVQKLVGGILT